MSKIENIIIADGVEQIENGAFDGCSLLKSILIPKSVNILPFSFLEGCDNLEYIECYEDSRANKYANDNEISVKFLVDDVD